MKYTHISDNLISERILDSVGKVVQAQYQMPVRYYHTFQHALDVLNNVEKMHQLDDLEYPQETALAALYHDAIFVPGSKTNEIESMKLALRHLASFNDEIVIHRITHLIWLTSLHFQLTDLDLHDDEDAKIFLDCDIYGFAAPRDVFLRQNLALDAEFFSVNRHVKDKKDYLLGRRKFLNMISQRGHVFNSKHYRENFDEAALNNIEFEIERVTKELRNISTVEDGA